MRGIISVIVIAAIAALAAQAAPAKHSETVGCVSPTISNVHWTWNDDYSGLSFDLFGTLDNHGTTGTLILGRANPDPAKVILDFWAYQDYYPGDDHKLGLFTELGQNWSNLGDEVGFSIAWQSKCGAGVLVSFTAVVGKAGRLQTPSQQTPAACGQKYLVIGSRGSGDAKNGNPATTKYGDVADGMSAPGTAFAVAFANLFPKGAVTFVHNPYAAVGLAGGWRHLVNLIGGGQPLPKLGAYKDSVREGIQRLEELVPREARVCPNVKVILVGYSQGAQVVGDAVQHHYWPNVAAVVLFGDPRFNNADPASHGNFNRQKHGILGKRPVFGGWLSGKVVSYCHRYDPVCQEWMAPWTFRTTGMREHTDYQMADDPQTAATMVERLLK